MNLILLFAFPRQAAVFTQIGVIVTVGAIALMVRRYIPTSNEQQATPRVTP
jgi:hypothetical protein